MNFAGVQGGSQPWPGLGTWTRTRYGCARTTRYADSTCLQPGHLCLLHRTQTPLPVRCVKCTQHVRCIKGRAFDHVRTGSADLRAGPGAVSRSEGGYTHPELRHPCQIPSCKMRPTCTACTHRESVRTQVTVNQTFGRDFLSKVYQVEKRTMHPQVECTQRAHTVR